MGGEDGRGTEQNATHASLSFQKEDTRICVFGGGKRGIKSTSIEKN